MPHPLPAKLNWKSLKLPEPKDIAIMRGDNRNPVFDVYDDTGASVVITGATITFQVRPAVGGASTFSRSVGSGITIDGTVTNRFTVAIIPSNTSTLDPGTYKYGVEMVLSGSTTTVAHGNFYVVGEP